MKAALLIVGTVTCFAFMDATAKWLGTVAALPSLQVVAFRYLVSVVFASLLLNPLRLREHARTRRPALQIGRSAMLVLSTTCSYVAVCHMELTVMTTLVFAAPLITPLLAGPLLGEKIGPRRIIAVLIGFAGVLVVTRPFGHAFDAWALLPLAGALLNALYSIATRKLAASDPPETTLFYTGTVGSAVLLPVLFGVWQTPPTPLAWTLLLLIGALGALAHWLLILAHRRAAASFLAPFNYAQLLWTIVIGRVAFGEIPDAWTLTGGGIIIAAGLYVFHRERVRAREGGAGTTAS
ncbi:MAG: DMT family transporter [Puniceicoccales bacterium]|jgi:drug/metabolite transporter (DMT)-like permease|nr:DMT family transporter [Puniceicoccales bacterium]